MTTKQAAEYLGVTRPRGQQLIRDKLLPAELFGRDYRLERADVERYRQERARLNEGKKGRPFRT